MNNFTKRWAVYCEHHPLKQAENYNSRVRAYLEWCHDKWRKLEFEHKMELFGDTPREKGEPTTTLSEEFKKRDRLFNGWIVGQRK